MARFQCHRYCQKLVIVGAYRLGHNEQWEKEECTWNDIDEKFIIVLINMGNF